MFVDDDGADAGAGPRPDVTVDPVDLATVCRMAPATVSAVASSSAAASRIRADRPPGARSATATASHPAPASPDPGPSGRRSRRPSGTSRRPVADPGQPFRVRQPTTRPAARSSGSPAVPAAAPSVARNRRISARHRSVRRPRRRAAAPGATRSSSASTPPRRGGRRSPRPLGAASAAPSSSARASRGWAPARPSPGRGGRRPASSTAPSVGEARPGQSHRRWRRGVEQGQVAAVRIAPAGQVQCEAGEVGGGDLRFRWAASRSWWAAGQHR